MRQRLLGMIAVLSFVSCLDAWADQYHYKDLVIGDRAAGLGGAYTALSDDPSGMYYNPAGIIFSMENYLSLSVNAFSNTTETYKNIAPGKNYTYTSSSLTPAFFGFLQNVGKGKFGISVVVPNSDLIDQNDSLTGLTSEADKGNVFKRRFFHKDITYLIGPSYAREVFTNFAVGISLPVGIRTDNVIDNQYAIFNPPSGSTDSRWWFQESYRNTTTYSLQPKLGFQYMPAPKLALGMTVSMPFKLGGSGQYTSRYLNTSPTDPPNGIVSHDITSTEGPIDPRAPSLLRGSFGAAYFFSKQFLLSGEFDLTGPDSKYNNGEVAAVPFAIRTTWNAALGTEYYLSDTFAMRLGAYTNRANTAKISARGTDQAPHVDQYFGALGFSYFNSGTSLSLTSNYGLGRGTGQGVGGTTDTQDIERRTINVMLSGSYQM